MRISPINPVFASPGRGTRRQAKHSHPSRGRPQQAKQHPQGGGLARAVQAEQPERLARRDRRVQAVHSGHRRTEPLHQPAGLHYQLTTTTPPASARREPTQRLPLVLRPDRPDYNTLLLVPPTGLGRLPPAPSRRCRRGATRPFGMMLLDFHHETGDWSRMTEWPTNSSPTRVTSPRNRPRMTRRSRTRPRVYNYWLGGKDNISQVVSRCPHNGRTATIQARHTRFSNMGTIVARELCRTSMGGNVRYDRGSGRGAPRS